MAIRWQNRRALTSIALSLTAASGCSRYVNTLDGPSPLAGAYAFRSYRMVGWNEGPPESNVSQWPDEDHPSTDDDETETAPAVIIRDDGSFDLRALGALSLFASPFEELTTNLRRPGDRAHLTSEDASRRDYLEVTHCEFTPHSSAMEYVGRGWVRQHWHRISISMRKTSHKELDYRFELERTPRDGRLSITGKLVRIPRERWPFDFFGEWPSEPPPEPGDANGN